MSLADGNVAPGGEVLQLPHVCMRYLDTQVPLTEEEADQLGALSTMRCELIVGKDDDPIPWRPRALGFTDTDAVMTYCGSVVMYREEAEGVSGLVRAVSNGDTTLQATCIKDLLSSLGKDGKTIIPFLSSGCLIFGTSFAAIRPSNNRGKGDKAMRDIFNVIFGVVRRTADAPAMVLFPGHHPGAGDKVVISGIGPKIIPEVAPVSVPNHTVDVLMFPPEDVLGSRKEQRDAIADIMDHTLLEKRDCEIVTQIPKLQSDLAARNIRTPPPFQPDFRAGMKLVFAFHRGDFLPKATKTPRSDLETIARRMMRCHQSAGLVHLFVGFLSSLLPEGINMPPIGIIWDTATVYIIPRMFVERSIASVQLGVDIAEKCDLPVFASTFCQRYRIDMVPTSILIDPVTGEGGCSMDDAATNDVKDLVPSAVYIQPASSPAIFNRININQNKTTHETRYEKMRALFVRRRQDASESSSMLEVVPTI